jgi:hypothetical protein
MAYHPGHASGPAGLSGAVCRRPALLIGWGAFIRWNRSAEELEPDALGKAKAEDRKVEK